MGGSVRSIKNLVDYLGDENDFKKISCDRDHGYEDAYPNIKGNDWNSIRKTQVYYVPPKGFKFKVIKELANEYDLVYFCACCSNGTVFYYGV